MKIYIICSKSFYKKIPPIKATLEKIGHVITVPNHYDDPKSEARVRGTNYHADWKAGLILHSEKVVSSVDAVLVINYTKGDVKNYIGGSTFLEMYDAFRLGKQIYMMNDIPEGILKDEIIGFNPIIIYEDLTKIRNK